MGGLTLKFCKNCGAKLKPGEKFCHNCGTAIVLMTEENSKDKKKVDDNTSFNQKETKQNKSTQGSFDIIDGDQPRKVDIKKIGVVAGILIIILAFFGYHSYSTNVNHVVTGKAYSIFIKPDNGKKYESGGYLVFGKGSNKGKVVSTDSKSDAIDMSKDSAKFADAWTKNSDTERDDVDYTFNKLRYTATKNSIKMTAYLDSSNASVNNSLNFLSLHDMKVSGGTITGTGTFTTEVYDDGDTDSYSVQAVLKPANY